MAENRPKRQYVWIILTVVIVVVVGALAFHRPVNQGSAKHGPFRIALVNWVGYGPFYIAQDKGYFTQEGLTVEIQRIEDEGARRAAFTTGRIDGAVNTIDALGSGVPKGVPGITIFKIDDSFGGDGIIATNNIRSVRDLKGKTVAYPKGLPGHFFLLYQLKKNGMTTKDIQSRYMEAPDAGAAFVAGKVDAAITWEPWLSQAQKRGHILVSTKDAPGLIMDIFMINPQARSTRREDVLKLMRAWFRAIDFVKAQPAEGYKIIAKHLGGKPAEIEAMAGGIKYANLEDNSKYFGLATGTHDQFSPLFEETEEIWKTEGVITRTVPAKKVMDTSFLREIQANK